MTTTPIRSKRSGNYEKKPNSKRQQQEKQVSNWSDLPRDIVERLMRRLLWTDRIRIRAVCKAWSGVPIRHVPVIDKLPWAVKSFTWGHTDNHETYAECRVLELDPPSREYVLGGKVLDPVSREYVVRGGELDPLSRECIMRGEECGVKECRAVLDPSPVASVDGWFLFRKPYHCKFETQMPYFLFSPFTNEVIRVPKMVGPKISQYRITFSTTPKCVVFVVGLDLSNRNTYVNLYSVCDKSWKIFKIACKTCTFFCPKSVIYLKGVFYCVFASGDLGAYNVESEEWNILTNGPGLEGYYFNSLRLIASDDGSLLRLNDDEIKLFKFDFSRGSWVCQRDFNFHVLFIGITSVVARAVGQTSTLTDSIFSCGLGYPEVRNYVYRRRYMPLYHKCAEAAKYAKAWIQLRSGGIWRANDLINGT